VTLYNRSYGRIARLRDRGYVEVEGESKGIGELSYIGTDLALALADRDVIMIVTTATGHRPLAERMAPLLRNGQIILLNPGRTFGALEVWHVLRERGCTADVIVGEANTLIYVSRVTVPGRAIIKAVKKEVSISAVLADNTPYLLERLRDAYPQFVPAPSFLATSLGNIGAVFHPTIALLNKRRILAGVPFDFYTAGVTRRTARFLERVDGEVQTLAKALDIRALSVTEWLNSRYGLERADIHTMLHANPSYRNIKAPTTLDHRYLWEDIPTGLVPISAVAGALGIETLAIDHLIDEGSLALGRDFRKEGRTLEKLGLSADGLKDQLSGIISGEKAGPRAVSGSFTEAARPSVGLRRSRAQAARRGEAAHA
jgi:opine dehydrogenase